MDEYEQDVEDMKTVIVPVIRMRPEDGLGGKMQAEGEVHRRRLLRRKRRVPVVRQMSLVECGAACLAMILSYYGHKTTISEVRERCGVGRDGLSALSIVKSARKYG